MPLSLATLGKKEVILKINGKDGTRRLLSELGFIVGGEIMVHQSMMGSVIVEVKNSRVALDQHLAARIII